MPTIVVAPPGGVVAPGMNLTAISDFIGPVPPDASWQLVLLDRTSETTLNHWRTPFVSKTQSIALSLQNLSTTQVGVAAPDGTQVDIDARITSGSGITDQGISGPFTWNNTATLPNLLREVQSGGSGALTPIQAEQLEETHASTFLNISLDSLTLAELTSGPQGGFVNAFLPEWIYGVIVRIASVPPEFSVNTPDGDYWTKTLAVVRIYRGSDLWKRVPVHTSSKLISFVDEGLITAVAQIIPVNWLLQLSVQVSFGDGVTGQVFLMRLP